MWPLKHNSEICFAGLNKKVFIFMSMEATSDSLPPELTTKSMVSNVLGKGACCEIRLSFMVPDLHRVAIKIICKCTIFTTINGGNSSSNLLNKVRILQSVNDPCIINREDVIGMPNFLFIVLELAEGVELFDKIIKKTKLNKAEAMMHFLTDPV